VDPVFQTYNNELDKMSTKVEDVYLSYDFLKENFIDLGRDPIQNLTGFFMTL